MPEEESLEGWAPEPGAETSLAEVVEHAFDYRGNVTIVTLDGKERQGYVFNRDAGAPEPFIEWFDATGEGPHVTPYRDIHAIRFTGKDMARGRSYEAWLRRKAEGRAHEPWEVKEPDGD